MRVRVCAWLCLCRCFVCIAWCVLRYVEFCVCVCLWNWCWMRCAFNRRFDCCYLEILFLKSRTKSKEIKSTNNMDAMMLCECGCACVSSTLYISFHFSLRTHTRCFYWCIQWWWPVIERPDYVWRKTKSNHTILVDFVYIVGFGWDCCCFLRLRFFFISLRLLLLHITDRRHAQFGCIHHSVRRVLCFSLWQKME